MMTTNQDLLLSSIKSFYTKAPSSTLELLYKIIQSEYTISLRVIDWFITHYTRSNNVVIWLDTSNNDTLVEDNTLVVHQSKLKKIHIYLEYRAQLKSYTKMFFDPFRRHQRISFLIKTNPLTMVETTIGQLNFFRWIFNNNILEYIERHQQSIEEDMTNFQSIKKAFVNRHLIKDENEDKEKNKERRHQSLQATTSCFLHFD